MEDGGDLAADLAAKQAWIESLVEESPDLRPIYKDHVGYYDELLAHLLFGDVIRWIEGLYAAGEYGTIKAFVDRIERDYPTLGPGARNVIDVSFAEDLPYPGPRGGEIALWLGPNLRRE